MTINEGSVDRGLRTVVGLALLAFTVLSDSPMRWWGLIGFLPLVTGAIGWCPAYSLFGISTCGKKAPPTT